VRKDNGIPSFGRIVIASTPTISFGGEWGSNRCSIIDKIILASNKLNRLPMHDLAPALKGTE
jgi:hypothetical protein